MSSDRSVRNTPAESPRVPAPGYSARGEPAPKPRATAVGDGKQVNSPVLARGDAPRKLSSLIGLVRAAKGGREITLAYEPYPKPTQVDW